MIEKFINSVRLFILNSHTGKTLPQIDTINLIWKKKPSLYRYLKLLHSLPLGVIILDQFSKIIYY